MKHLKFIFCAVFLFFYLFFCGNVFCIEDSDIKPVLEYTVIGLSDYGAFSEWLLSLQPYFNAEGIFIPINSSLIENYAEENKISFLPFIFVKTKNFQAVKILKERFGFKEYEDGFFLPKKNLISKNVVYYLNRVPEQKKLDIIASPAAIRRIKNSSFMDSFKKAGLNIKFHKKNLFSNPVLYKELNLKKLPLILWRNKYLTADFKKLLEMDEFMSLFNGRPAENKVLIDYFSSVNCGYCRFINDKVLPGILKKYSGIIDIVKFNAGNYEDYQFMLEMEKKFNVKKPGIPKMFINGSVLTGKNEIENYLALNIINSFIKQQSMFKVQEPLFCKFYCKNNQDCQKIINTLKERYGKNIKVEVFLLNSSSKQVPEVIIKGDTLKGYSNIKNNIDRIIQKNLIFVSKDSKKNKQSVFNLKNFSLPAVITAGLLDGINPCAFTVIIFFISFLAITGYRKKDIAVVCLFFIIAVFGAYFLIGLGIFTFFYKLSAYKTAAQAVRYIVLVMVFFLAGLNLYDFIVYKIKKTPKSIILQLPYKIKILIHKIIGLGYRKKKKDKPRKTVFLAFIAFIVGFAVSVLESVCTGQVYFPTVAFISGLSDIVKLKALFYLFIYNIMFVLPLVVIFVFAFAGATSEQFNGLMKKNLGKIKFFTFLLFLFLGCFLIILYY